MRRPALLLTSAALVAAAVITAAPSGAASADVTGSAVVLADAGASAKQARLRFRAAVKRLKVRADTRGGYKRAKFGSWVDADRDCQNTRHEVLVQESKRRVTLASSGCTVTAGRWRSRPDGAVVTDPAKLDIDHLVPLAEAYRSGAKKWTRATRKSFANDLGDRRSLNVVTAGVNRSKGDRDPARWLPERARCAYVKDWVAVKLRWRLTVDRAEKRAIRKVARGCSNTVITYKKATVRKKKTGSGSGGGTSGTDPRFDTCGDANAAGYGNYVDGRDPEYDWYQDRDGDGVACEF
ncbi:excalibur calcium-binding domain-containing protein [Solicola sp. PLA-1-18]|uniref:excalibur calcium-binding domain-containing protein n=1 Tax=Solicola sp. PLA-1-18 TaxID=3380532 RepID=UPI003B7A4836